MRISYKNDTFHLKNLEKDIISWEANIEAIGDCRRVTQTNSAKYCHNFIRVIALEPEDEYGSGNGRLLVCGTYAGRPTCSWREKGRLNEIADTFDGMGKCPKNFESSLAYLRTENGDFYFGTSIDYSEQGMKADYLIDRSLGPSQQVRTDQYNSNWLNDPTFVASVAIGEYVYFFIRETAVEYMNCGMVVKLPNCSFNHIFKISFNFCIENLFASDSTL